MYTFGSPLLASAFGLLFFNLFMFLVFRTHIDGIIVLNIPLILTLSGVGLSGAFGGIIGLVSGVIVAIAIMKFINRQ